MAPVHRLYPLPFMDGHPLKESEWRHVLALLEQVNLPKAKVLNAIYREHVTTAWRNYLSVYDEAYGRIEEMNRRLDEQREQYEGDLKMYLSKLEEREAFWEDRIREPREEYMRLSVSVEGMQNAWPEKLTQSVHGAREYWDVIRAMSRRESEIDAPPAGATKQNADFDQQSSPAPVASGPHGEPGTEPIGSSAQQSNPREPTLPPEDLPALTKEEVADETQLPTFAEPPIPVWLRLALTATLGLLSGYLLCVATAVAEPTAQAIALAALGASAVLYGVWEATRSAAAIASEAFHLEWVETRRTKLRAIVWLFGSLVLATSLMQAVWHVFVASNTSPGTAFTHGPASTTGYLLWTLWPWFLLLATLDGFLRGRGEAVGNRIRAEVVRAKRADAFLKVAARRGIGEERYVFQPTFDSADGSLGGNYPGGQEASKTGVSTADSEGARLDSAIPDAASAPEATLEGSADPHQSPTDLLMQYRAKRAEYESLRRQRDLELAFIGRRIKDMQTFLAPTRFVPSQIEQTRIEMARSDYEKVCTWFLKQLADALRDVGGGLNAGEIIRRFTEQFGMTVPSPETGTGGTDTHDGDDSRNPVRGLK